MGGWCSTERSQDNGLRKDKLPLRANELKTQTHKIGEITPEPEEATPSITREEKAKMDWIRLIDNGRNPDSWLVEEVAQRYDDLNIAETLFSNGDRAIHKAVRADNLELVYSLVEDCDADINAPQARTGDTPLILSAKLEKIDMVKLLIGKVDEKQRMHARANPSLQNEQGESAIDIASDSTNKKLWALLCPDKLAAHIIATERTPEPPRSPNKTPSPSGESIIDIPPMSESLSSRRDSIEAKPKPFVDPLMKPIKRRASATDIQTHEETKTEEARARPPSLRIQRSSSLNVLGGLPEDIAMAAETKQGWIQKRKPDWLASWQTRYLIITGDYIGWATDEVKIEDPNHPRERKKFNSYEMLDRIDRVEPVESTSQCKFKVFVSNSTKNNAPRHYEFKAKTPDERSEWMQAIKRAVKRVRKKKMQTPRRSADA